MCNNEHGCLSNGPDGSLPAACVTYDRVFHEPRNTIVTRVMMRGNGTTISRGFATRAKRAARRNPFVEQTARNSEGDFFQLNMAFVQETVFKWTRTLREQISKSILWNIYPSAINNIWFQGIIYFSPRKKSFSRCKNMFINISKYFCSGTYTKPT